MTSPSFWMALGFLGQLVFGARFVVQWIVSERAGRSVVPTVFWHLSLGGTALLLAYAIYRRDPVFIAGQSAGAFVYLRNLSLIERQRQTENDLAVPSEAP